MSYKKTNEQQQTYMERFAYHLMTLEAVLGLFLLIYNFIRINITFNLIVRLG